MSSTDELGLTNVSFTTYEFSHSDEPLTYALRNLTLSSTILFYLSLLIPLPKILSLSM